MLTEGYRQPDQLLCENTKSKKRSGYIPVCLFSFQSVKYTLLDDAASHCNAAAAPAAATPKTLFYTLHNH